MGNHNPLVGAVRSVTLPDVSPFCQSAIPPAGFGLDEPGDPIIDQRHTPALAHDAVMEPLEQRVLMSVTVDSAGWTVVTPAADSRVVYVSSSAGSDSNNGLSPNAPVKTLARGASLIRDNSADQLLLKRGDAWSEQFGYWRKSGRSEQEPVVIGAYGQGNRPIIKTGNKTGITIGSISAQRINHLSIIGVHFYADGRDPSIPGFDKMGAQSYGINVVAGGTGLRIEDVKLDWHMTNMAVVPYYGQMNNITIRRSVFADAYGNKALKSAYSEGLFISGSNGILLEENVFDHNGWLAGVAGAEPDIYNHNVYLVGDTSNATVRGNVFANAGSHGLQARSGGVVTGNLFLNNPIGMSYGVVNGNGPQRKGGVNGQVTDNVFLGGRDINGELRGIGLEIANVKAGAGALVARNIFAHYTGGNSPAIMLTYGMGVYQNDAVGLNDVTLKDNIIYDWKKGLWVASGFSPTAIDPFKKFTNVKAQGNSFMYLEGPALANTSQMQVDVAGSPGATTVNARSFPDPNRSIAGYAKSVGGLPATWQFLSNARGLAKGAWNAVHTAKAAADYIRAGFGLGPIGGTSVTPPTVPPVAPPVVPPPPPPPVVPPAPPPPVVPPAPPPIVPPPVTPPADVPIAPPVVEQPKPRVRRQDAPAYVKAMKLSSNRGVQKLVVKFSRDVGSTIDLNDLSLLDAGGVPVDLTAAQFVYNAKKKTAMWVLASDATTKLARGDYTVRLSAAGIVDDQGHALDGDRDRTGGDDFTRAVRVRR